MSLYAHQETFVDRIEAEWSMVRSVVGVMPTGGGKTRCGVTILANRARPGRRALWVVHRRELVAQASETIRELTSLSTAEWHSGNEKRDADVICTTIQTLTLEDEPPPDVDTIIIDECHRAPSASYLRALDKMPGAQILGLTATPERQDGKAMGDVFERMVVGPSYAELIEGGFLVDCDVIAPREYTKRLAEHPVSAWQRYSKGNQGFIFADSVAVSKRYAEALGGFHVDATTPGLARDKAFMDFREGKLKLLCSVQVLTEGIDFPAAQVAVLARRIGSPGTYIQMVGRVLRSHPNKKKATVVDLAGNVHAHGLPTEGRTYSLRGKPIDRDPELQVRRCNECFAITRMGPDKCPRCGAPFTTAAREALEIEKQKMGVVTRPAAGSDVKRATYLKWKRMARERGWKPGAVEIRFQRTFGHRPPAQWKYEV